MAAFWQWLIGREGWSWLAGLETRMEGSPVLVTGATGFIGSRLLDRLGPSVEAHAVSRRDQPVASGSNQRWWRADLSDLAQTRELVAAVKPRVIFHLASEVACSREVGIVPVTLQSNLVSTVNLMTAAVETRVQKIVMAGSMEEPSPSDPDPVPCSPYAAAKWAVAGYARMFHALYQLDAVVLRVFMVYGPGQQDLRKLVPYTLVTCLRGESPKLSSGRRKVDWVYVDDVTEAFVRAAQRQGLGGRTLDVGTGEATSVRTVAEKLLALTNPGVGLEIGALPDRPLERECVADATVAVRCSDGDRPPPWMKVCSRPRAGIGTNGRRARFAGERLCLGQPWSHMLGPPSSLLPTRAYHRARRGLNPLRICGKSRTEPGDSVPGSTDSEQSRSRALYRPPGRSAAPAERP